MTVRKTWSTIELLRIHEYAGEQVTLPYSSNAIERPYPQSRMEVGMTVAEDDGAAVLRTTDPIEPPAPQSDVGTITHIGVVYDDAVVAVAPLESSVSMREGNTIEITDFTLDLS